VFEQAPQKREGYLRSVRGSLDVLPRRYTALLLLAVVMLIPYPTTVVPEWKIRVLDRYGAPVEGEPVREVWQHYSYESESHGEELPTDADGYVTFREREIWASPLRRVVFTCWAALWTLAHGSMGESAWVLVPGRSAYHPEFVYKAGTPLPVQYRVDD